MLAALAHLMATMPRIPDYHYLFLFIPHIHLPNILYAIRDVYSIEPFGVASILERRPITAYRSIVCYYRLENSEVIMGMMLVL
jgi:hypothetical protein